MFVYIIVPFLDLRNELLWWGLSTRICHVGRLVCRRVKEDEKLPRGVAALPPFAFSPDSEMKSMRPKPYAKLLSTTLTPKGDKGGRGGAEVGIVWATTSSSGLQCSFLDSWWTS